MTTSMDSLRPGDPIPRTAVPEDLYDSLNWAVRTTPLNSRLGREIQAALPVLSYLPRTALVEFIIQSAIGAAMIRGSDSTLEKIRLPDYLPGDVLMQVDWYRDEGKMALLTDVLSTHRSVIEIIAEPFARDPQGRKKVSLLDEFVVGFDDRDREKRKSAVLSELNGISYTFMDMDKYFSLMPDSTVARNHYGSSFWVQEMPLIGTLLYTDKAQALSHNPQLLYSNMIHELAGHILMGLTIPIALKGRDGKVMELESNTVLPIWYREGTANIVALRFTNTDVVKELYGSPDFFDFFLSQFDGRIPTSREIMQADFELPYFYFHLFTMYILQSLGRSFYQPATISSHEHPDLLHAHQGLALLNKSMAFAHQRPYQLPVLPSDISTNYVRHIYDTLALPFLRHRSLGVPGDIPQNFAMVCAEYDIYKEKYLKNYVERYCAENQKIQMRNYLATV